MKKARNVLAVLVMFVGIGAFTSANPVGADSWRLVQKWFKSDYNIYTKKNTDFDFQNNTDWYQIGSGWNYIRYQNTRHYHGGY